MKSTGKKYSLILLGAAVVIAIFLAVELKKPDTADAASAAPAPTASSPAAEAPAGAPAPLPTDAAVRDKVIEYVRARFGLPSTVNITVDDFKPALHADFEETTIHTSEGTNKSDNTAYVTKDRKWLVLGKLVPVQADPKAELVSKIREQFKIPAAANITASDFRSSSYPKLLASTVAISMDGKPAQSQEFFMTSDRKALVVGGVFDLTQNLQQSAIQTIDTVNQPRSGPANAPVTIVEYADLQCPTCARMHDVLENDILKRYPGKVQVVFKEFPIASIHDWTMTASLSSQCVYQINPKAFVPFRSTVFKNQAGITAANVRDSVLAFGEQVGIDRLRLAGCVDSKASLPRVEANFLEGKKLGVQSTPTIFVNGQMMVGIPQGEELHQRIEAILRGGK